MKRVERVRLYPSRSQQKALQFMLDVTRQLYNAALQERRGAYRSRGVSISAKQQYAELTALRSRSGRLDTRLSAVYRECEDAALHRLDLAMQAFFRRVKRVEVPGYPRFKPASRWKQLEFSHGDRALRFDRNQTRLTVPGVGSVRLRKGRAVPTGSGRAWIRERNGRWYACFERERDTQPLPVTGIVLGIDQGVHVLAALSDGTLIRNIAVGEKRKAATARLQRELDALTQKDGQGRCRNRQDPNRKTAARRLARAREREANTRRDYAHKVAKRLVNAADTLVLEKLQVRKMTRSAKGTIERPGRSVASKAGLNRVILDAGFGLLRRMIVAKAESAARAVIEVDPRFSSQECSRCGHVASESRKKRRFNCIACGYANHADVNAALVIRRRGESRLKSGLIPGEEPGRQARFMALAHTTNHKV